MKGDVNSTTPNGETFKNTQNYINETNFVVSEWI